MFVLEVDICTRIYILYEYKELTPLLLAIKVCFM